MTWLDYYNQRFIDEHLGKVVLIAAVLAILVTLILCFAVKAHAQVCPTNLWQGLIAEDTAGNYQDYLVIASCVRNRLLRNMDNGLVALQRKNLRKFVEKEIAYALKTKGLDLQKIAKQATKEVFSGKDYAYGADHYEHTGVYPMPPYFKKMKIVKILHKGTKQEITLARSSGK